MKSLLKAKMEEYESEFEFPQLATFQHYLQFDWLDYERHIRALLRRHQHLRHFHHQSKGFYIGMNMMHLLHLVCL